MKHDDLATIIERYTPDMKQLLSPASPEEMARIEAAAGPLSDSYRHFLSWMGNCCPFLAGVDLAYTPRELLEMVYDDSEVELPEGFQLFGIDKSGSCFDLFIRVADGAIVRLSEYYDGVRNEDLLFENFDLRSFLLRTYVEETLVPSHPFHFATVLTDEHPKEEWLFQQLNEACGPVNFQYFIDLPDFRFYGGDDFVIGIYERPLLSSGSFANLGAVVSVSVGIVDHLRHQSWSEFFMKKWRLPRLPIV